MLTTIMHPMLAAMDGRDFRNFMEAFLRFARKSWFNYAWSLGMGIGPIVAVVLLWGDPGSTSFVLTAIGLGVVVVGGVRGRERLEGAALRRDAGLGSRGDAGGLGGGRRRYLTINWLQFATTWTAFVLFLVALVSL